jgi:hypothetical protein
VTAFFITFGALALIAVACWVAYDAGRYSALDELDGHIEVARALGAYGITLRLEAAQTGIPVEALLERDGLNLDDANKARIVREHLARGGK